MSFLFLMSMFFGGGMWDYEGETPTFVTVTLNANGGSVEEASISVVPNNAVGMLPEPIRGGYDFLGWFTAVEGGDEVTADTVVTGNMTVYAQWEEIAYTYNYIDNGDGTVTLSKWDEYGNWIGDCISPSPVGDFTLPTEIDGKTVVAIFDDYFSNCGEMTSIIIPASVTNLSGNVMAVYSLTNIMVAADNPAYKSVDGMLYTKDGYNILFGGDVITVSLKTPRVDGSVAPSLKDADDKSGFLVDPDKVTVTAAPTPDPALGETLGALPVNAVPGLWYRASWGDSLDNMTEGEWVQATSPALYLGVIKQTGERGFYKLKVSEK